MARGIEYASRNVSPGKSPSVRAKLTVAPSLSRASRRPVVLKSAVCSLIFLKLGFENPKFQVYIVVNHYNALCSYVRARCENYRQFRVLDMHSQPQPTYAMR